jgi:hypothetical protein
LLFSTASVASPSPAPTSIDACLWPCLRRRHCDLVVVIRVWVMVSTIVSVQNLWLIPYIILSLDSP